MVEVFVVGSILGTRLCTSIVRVLVTKFLAINFLA